MAKNKPDTCCGVLVVNKHEGVTSHRIISAIRKLYDTARVGHTGTLDPLATGVLPILIGRAAKASDYLMAEDKRYTAEMKLGLTTDTEDITGTVLTQCDILPSEGAVQAVCREFVGKIFQVPPMYSAIKVDGRKLVDIAREGGEVERKAREVEIYRLNCEKISDDTYRLDVACSKGTYIRTLCKDIGEKLGCGAVMSALVRTQTGVFTLEQAVTIAELEQMSFEERLTLPKPVESLFTDIPAININEFYAKLIRGGTELYQKKLHTDYPVGQLLRLRCKGEFIALGRVTEYETGTAVKPEKLFVL